MNLAKYLSTSLQGLMPGESSGMPQDDAMMELELKRKMKFADALRGQEAPQGQMVSGHYVAPSWTQHLAGLAGKYQAGQKEKEGIEQYGEYAKGKQAKMAEALAQYQKDLMPRTEQAPQQPTTVTGSTGEIAPNMGMVNEPPRQVPLTANDRYAALLKYGAAAGNPQLMQQAMVGGLESANKAEDVAGERAFREKQTAGEQEFQRIQAKERNNQDLTMQERSFANQFALQKSNQGFQAGQNALSRQASQSAAPSGYTKNADGSLKPIKGGPADPDMKPLNEGQANARLYGNRMTASHNIVNKLEAEGKPKYNPLTVKAILTGPGAISEIAYAQSNADTQSAAQAMRDFINATLRRESGAAISASEYDSAMKQYFPQIGEDKAVTAQKKANREVAIQGILDAGYMPGQTRPTANKEVRVNY
jgi:hypothetical protein